MLIYNQDLRALNTLAITGASRSLCAFFFGI